MHENSKKTIFGLLITAAVCILLLPLFTCFSRAVS